MGALCRVPLPRAGPTYRPRPVDLGHTRCRSSPVGFADKALAARKGNSTMASGTLADEIRLKLGELSPAERKVGRVMLAGYPAAGFETIATIAERAAVSAPTVLRFVGRLGFRGYPDFQAALRTELDERSASPLSLYESAVHNRRQRRATRARPCCSAAADSSPRHSPRASWNSHRTTSAVPPNYWRTPNGGSSSPGAASPISSRNISACTSCNCVRTSCFCRTVMWNARQRWRR